MWDIVVLSINGRLSTTATDFPGVRLRSALDLVRRQEEGFTLVELLVAMALLGVALVAIAGVLQTTEGIAGTDRDRSLAVREAQVGLDRLTRQLRQVNRTSTWSGSAVDVDTVLAGQPVTVRFDCGVPSTTVPSLRRCVRYRLSGGVASGAQTIIDRVANPGGRPVFSFTGVNTASVVTGSYATNTAICVAAATPGALGNAITVEMRNPLTANARLYVPTPPAGSTNIVVRLGTNAVGSVNSTARQVAAAIMNGGTLPAGVTSGGAAALVTAGIAAGSNGTGTVPSAGAVALAGGGQPLHAGVRIEVPSNGERSAGEASPYSEVFQDGVTMRNVHACG